MIGKYYKPLSTFTIEGNTFKKGIDYQLISVEEEEKFKLYIFITGNQTLLFGDYDDDFEEIFKLSTEERVKIINTLLYED